MADRSDEGRDKRQGDILGLGGAPAPIETDIPDNSTHGTRRRRHLGDEDATIAGPTDMPRGNGATGIDMGAGGEGTDIE